MFVFVFFLCFFEGKWIDEERVRTLFSDEPQAVVQAWIDHVGAGNDMTKKQYYSLCCAVLAM